MCKRFNERHVASTTSYKLQKMKKTRNFLIRHAISAFDLLLYADYKKIICDYYCCCCYSQNSLSYPLTLTILYMSLLVPASLVLDNSINRFLIAGQINIRYKSIFIILCKRNLCISFNPVVDVTLLFISFQFQLKWHTILWKFSSIHRTMTHLTLHNVSWWCHCEN